MNLHIMSLGDHITDPVTGERPGPRDRHRMIVEAAVRAESAGFAGVNVGEHHGLEYIYSSPPVLLAAIGERTTTLKLGTAVTLLANLDALRIAEDYATVDVLSGGRVQLVAGRGNFFATTYELFGQPVDESKDRFAENAELLSELWAGGPVHWSGRFRPSVNGEALQPPAMQPVSEAMWIGGGSSTESVDLAARLGWKLMLPSAFGNPEFFVPMVDYYLEKWVEYGNEGEPEIGACWHAFTASESQAAKSAWEPRYRAYHVWMQDLLGKVNPTLPNHHTRPFDFEWLTSEGPAIVGSPDEVVERISTLSEKLRLTTHLLYMDMGGMPEAALFDAIDLVGSKVLPQLAH